MYRVLFLLLLAPLFAAAQANQPSIANESAAQPPGSVDGRVTNAKTGDGISGATVRLIPMGPRGSTSTVRSGTSQADGTFTVDGLAPGIYLVMASQPNFTPGPNGGQAHTTVNVDPGQSVSNISLQLTPIGRIRGTIVDDEGNPVQGAEVEAFSTYLVRGKNQLRRISQVRTDEKGKFTVKAGMLGRYYIAAQPEDAPAPAKTEDQKPGTEQPALDLVRTFYSKALDIENATAVDLTPDQDAPDITIQLVRSAAHHIRGRIEGLTFDGRFRGPLITLAPRGSGGSDGLGTVARFEKDGTFDFPKVIPGSYTLNVTGTAPTDNASAGQSRMISRARLLARQDIYVGGDDVNGIVLTIIPLINLSGRVAIDGLDNADLSSVRVNLFPSAVGAGGGVQTIVVQRDGSFEIANLAPGQYMVQVLGSPSGTYIRSITYNRQDITTTGIDLTQGGAGEIDVVLRSGTGEVDGALQTSAQIASTTVMVLVPDTLAIDGSGVLIANMQSSSSFVLRNVPPGHYYAYAVERWSPLWQNPDFLRSIQNQGTTIDLPENGHLQVQLSLISTEQVEAAAVPLGLATQ